MQKMRQVCFVIVCGVLSLALRAMDSPTAASTGSSDSTHTMPGVAPVDVAPLVARGAMGGSTDPVLGVPIDQDGSNYRALAVEYGNAAGSRYRRFGSTVRLLSSDSDSDGGGDCSIGCYKLAFGASICAIVSFLGLMLYLTFIDSESFASTPTPFPPPF